MLLTLLYTINTPVWCALVKVNCSLNSTTQQLSTMQVRGGHDEVVRVLLKAKATVNTQDKVRLIVAHYAYSKL